MKVRQDKKPNPVTIARIENADPNEDFLVDAVA